MWYFKLKILLTAGTILLTACSGIQDENISTIKRIKLWIAPGVDQEAFWKIAVEKWNNSAQGLVVDFTTIPSTRSSEQTILTALVAENAPDISTNIFSGFAAQLANLGQLTDLSQFDGFSTLIAKRKMTSIMKSWQQQNDKQYVFPLYSNPTMVWWRKDILADLGIDKVPTTFEDVYQVSKLYSNGKDKFGMEVTAGDSGGIWADRFFDFISYYYATSNGAPYIDNNQAVYNNEYSIKVLSFIGTMFKNGWTGFDIDDPLIHGWAVGAIRGAWDISRFKRLYPKILENIVIGPMIASQTANKKHSTFADTKGLVIFKSSQLKKESFAFIRWVFSDDELSLLWLEKTGLPPARADLLTNPLFSHFYQQNPIAKAYAAYVDVAVPPAFIEHTIDVQKIMGIEMLEPILNGLKTPDTALNDAVNRTNRLLERSN